MVTNEVALGLVRTRTKGRVRERGAGAHGSSRYLLVLMAVGLCILTLYRYSAIARMGYEVNQLNQELRRLEQENGRLRLEVAQLDSVTRVETVARREIGLGEPTETKLVRVDEASGGLFAMLQSQTGSFGAEPRESHPREGASTRRSLLSRLLSASLAEARSSR